MNNMLISILIFITSLISSSHSSGLTEISSLEKKPAHLPEQYYYQSIHQFENTPFKDYDNFTESIIKESSNVQYKQINELNQLIRPVLDKIINENFFKIFRLNLYKQCPFWSSSEGFCMHKSCAVDTIDDWKDLPEIWQPEALGRIESLSEDIPTVTEGGNGSCVATAKTCASKDYCELDEFNEDSVYVNLVDNPERFTGYGGDQSFQIWKSIYNENCFSLGADQCVEKNFFYKLVSGMHSSISTHLTNDFLDLGTKKYGPNLKQFMIRVGDFPDRFENLYLNYIIVMKSLIKLERFGILKNLRFCEDDLFQSKEAELKQELTEIVSPFYQLAQHDKDHECLFKENSLFQSENSHIIKDEFRENFKNVSRIMDCVHCDRCRLWGKVQTTGYGTALKVLFELENHDEAAENFEISKIELIALINTFDRLSKTVNSINNFKILYDQAMEEEENGVELSTQEDEYDNFLMGNTLAAAEASEEEETANLVKPTETEQSSPREYDDIRFANFEEKSRFQLKQPIGEIFSEELNNVFVALKFVLSSYKVFPKIVYNWILVRVIYYWNTFVGHVHEDFDTDRLYRLEL